MLLIQIKNLQVVMANTPDMNLTELSARDMRKVYMITYSQGNLEKCPDRKTFAEFVLKAFDFDFPLNESSSL